MRRQKSTRRISDSTVTFNIKQTSGKLEKAIEDFRRQLFKKTPDDLRRKGSLLRIKTAARKVARLLVEATGQKKLPINLNPICQKMLIHSLIPDTGLSPYVSELIPDASGFTIKISEKERGIRRRSAIAHEIGHTLFYDTTKLPPARIFRVMLHRPQMDKEEWISWDFARELLLPTELVEQELSQIRFPSAKKILEFAGKWEVSVELLCHRVIRDLGIWRNCVMFTFGLEKNGIDERTIRIYRGKKFPRFRLLGREGLFCSSKEFSTLVKQLEKSEALEKSIEWVGLQMWVQLIKYSRLWPRVFGILEIPAIASRQD